MFQLNYFDILFQNSYPTKFIFGRGWCCGFISDGGGPSSLSSISDSVIRVCRNGPLQGVEGLGAEDDLGTMSFTKVTQRNDSIHGLVSIETCENSILNKDKYTCVTLGLNLRCSTNCAIWHWYLNQSDRYIFIGIIILKLNLSIMIYLLSFTCCKFFINNCSVYLIEHVIFF